MGNLAVDGLDYRVRFAANGDGPAEILGPERRDGLEQELPAGFPARENRFSRVVAVASNSLSRSRSVSRRRW